MLSVQVVPVDGSLFINKAEMQTCRPIDTNGDSIYRRL